MDSAYLHASALDSNVLRRLLAPLLRSASGSTDVPSAGSRSRARSRDPLRILDLACGPCREIAAVSAALRDAADDPARPVHFVGADIRGATLDEARARGRTLHGDGIATEFLDADCAKLARHRSIGDRFDLAILRHQNFWDHPSAWRRIFDAGLERLDDSGLLVITSYFDREHELALRALHKTGAKLVTTIRNPNSRQLDTPGKSVDRHIAVFRK